MLVLGNGRSKTALGSQDLNTSTETKPGRKSAAAAATAATAAAAVPAAKTNGTATSGKRKPEVIAAPPKVAETAVAANSKSKKAKK